MNTILESLKERMEKSIDSLKSAFNKIRTGRANPAILDDIKVDYYGNLTPLNQTSNVSVEENRTLVISPWDKNLMPEIEKAITSSDLGLNPSSSGDLIRVTMPTLTEETRQGILSKQEVRLKTLEYQLEIFEEMQIIKLKICNHQVKYLRMI